MSNHSTDKTSISKNAGIVSIVGVVVFAIVIVIPLSVRAGFLEDFFTASSTSSTTIPDAVLEGPADLALLSAEQNPNPIGGQGGADLLVDENALVATGPVGEDVLASQASQSSGEIHVYTVREGDSMSEVAEMFDVTINTILWANDLSKATDIQPGDSLVILPIAGVRHVVKEGDTIESIAKKYDGNSEEILAYNQLSADAAVEAGSTLIIPGGAITTVSATVKKSSSGGSVAASTNGFSHPAPGAMRTQGIHGYNAVDLAAGAGTAIRAAAAGEVIIAKASGWNGGYGNYIVIRHANGVQTLYAHLSSLYVGVGASVAQGANIGTMGNTGRSTGTHLHFEVRGGYNPF